MIRLKFIDDHKREYSIKRMCTVLEIPRSTFYKWQEGKPARLQRMMDDALQTARIRAVFDEYDGNYGRRRITCELNDQGVVINHKRVDRLMRAAGLCGYRKKKKYRTTVRSSRRVHDDLVNRQFVADAANRVLVGDITYLPVKGAKPLYLATVIDCFSRRLVGFSIADHMQVGLVVDALQAAAKLRGGLQHAVFHSDHGSVYTSAIFGRVCQSLQVTQSMGSVGSSADNALAESFNASLKREVLKDRKQFDNQDQARREVFRWCIRYNTKRRHSWCGNISPVQFEAEHQATLKVAI